ncbi:MAG: response regulator transcription factor [Actinomycetota bacterium]
MLTIEANVRGSTRPTTMLRVLVVDDHPVVRQGVGMLLRRDPDIVVVGEARCGKEGIDTARRLRPDVMLLDLRLPDMLASEAIPLLRMASPGTKIVIFTAYAGHRALSAAIEAGAHSCLRKDAAEIDLAVAIRRVVRGDRFVDPRLEQDGMPGRMPRSSGPPLTRREYEVLRRVAMGETNLEIANCLRLSRNTVKTYLQTALQKLGVRNRVEAIARANEIGLL